MTLKLTKQTSLYDPGPYEQGGRGPPSFSEIQYWPQRSTEGRISTAEAEVFANSAMATASEGL